jgi:hypothetical protein
MKLLSTHQIPDFVDEGIRNEKEMDRLGNG